MDIISTSSYLKEMISPARFTICLMVIGLALAEPATAFIGLPFVLYMLWSKLTMKYTYAIQADNGLLTLHYKQFFRDKQQEFRIADHLIELIEYQDDVREPRYYHLIVKHQDKIMYSVDSRDGYKKEDLLQLMKYM